MMNIKGIALTIVFTFILSIILQYIMFKVSDKIKYTYPKNQLYGLIILSTVLNTTIFVIYGFNIKTFLLSLIIMINLSSINIDLNYKEIPDSYNLITFLLGIVLIILTRQQYKIFILTGVISFSVYLIIVIISNGAMGGGDIKMAGALGFSMPYHLLFTNKLSYYPTWYVVTQEIIYFVFYSSLIGVLLSVFIIYFKNGKLKTAIPYGPFILIGYIMILINKNYMYLEILNVILLFLYTSYWIVKKLNEENNGKSSI